MRAALSGVAFALAMLAHHPAVHAATLTWGTSGTGGSGTWTATDGWWNGTTQQTWSNAAPDDAVFGGGAGDSGGSITLAGGTTTAGSITFNAFTGTYTIGTASQTLAINGGGITLNAGAGAVTIQNSPITLGAAQSWTNNSSSLFTVSSGITTGGNLLTVAGSGSTALSGAVAGTGGITKSGAGTLTLSAANSFSGGVQANAGLIVGGGANNTFSTLGSGQIAIGSSGTVQLSSINTANFGYAAGYTNAVSGSGVLSLLYPSTGDANNAVTYSGDLSNFSGTVLVSTARSGGYVAVGSGQQTNAINLSGSNARFVVTSNMVPAFGNIFGSTSGTLAMGEISGSGTIQGGAGVTATFLIGGLSTSSTFAGRFQDHVGTVSLTKVGSGTLTLTGATNNGINGTTRIDGGALQIGGAGVLRTGGYAGAMSIASGAAFDYASSANQTISGIISGSGTVLKSGAGTLTLSATNTYTGNTTISQGFLAITGTSALPGWDTAGRFSVASGAGIAVGDAVSDSAVTTLLGTGNFAANSFIGYDTTAGRTLTSPMAGSLGLAKLGSGTLTLTGSNSYTGGTTISAGVLQVGSGGATGSIANTSPVSVASGAAIAFNRSDALAYGGTVSGAGGLTKLGSGTLTLTGSNSYTGGTTISAGRLALTGNGVLGGGTYAGAIANAGELFVGSDVAQTLSGAISGSGSLTKSGLGTLTLSGNSTYSGGTRIDAGVVALGNAGALGTTGTISFGGGTLQFSGSNTTDYSARFSTAASQAYSFDTNGQNVSLGTGLNSSGGSFTKTGAGTLTLSGSNTYTGNTTISAGVLQVGSGGATGSIANTSPVSVASGAAIAFNRSDALAYGGTVSGAGGLTKLGSGTLTLTGSNSYTGGTTISAGRLALTGNGVLGGGTYAGAIANAGELFVGSDVAQTLSGVISGSGSLRKAGSGTVTLSGSSTYTGGTRIDAGVVALGNAGALGTTGTISFGGGTLQFSGSNTTDYSARFSTAASQAYSLDTNGQNVSLGTGLNSSGGSLTKTGAGTLTLSAVSTYAGPTTVSGGTLRLTMQNVSAFARDSGTASSLSVSNATVELAGNNELGNGSGPFVPVTVGPGGLLTQTSNKWAIVANTITLAGGTMAGGQNADATIGSYYFAEIGAWTPGVNVTADSTISAVGVNFSNLSPTFTVNSGVTLSVPGRFGKASGTGGLTLAGGGRMVLSGSNAYTGATTITSGRLEVGSTGQINSTSGITVSGVEAEFRYNSSTPLSRPLTLTQGRLSGTGTIATAVAAGSNVVLSPGNSPGVQAFTSGLTWNAGGTYDWELNALTGTAGTQWDLLNVTSGGLNLSGLSTSSQFNLNLITLDGTNAPGGLVVPYAPGSTYEFLVAGYTSLNVPSGFSSAAGSDLTGLFAINLTGWAGQQPNLGDISVRVNGTGDGLTVLIVPEPGALTLLGSLAVAAVAGLRRSRMRSR